MSSFVCLLFMIHYDLFGSSYARFYVSLLFIIRFYFFYFFWLLSGFHLFLSLSLITKKTNQSIQPFC